MVSWLEPILKRTVLVLIFGLTIPSIVVIGLALATWINPHLPYDSTFHETFLLLKKYFWLCLVANFLIVARRRWTSVTIVCFLLNGFWIIWALGMLLIPLPTPS